MVQRKNKAVYGILLLVFLFFVILMIFASYTMRMFQGEDGIDGRLSNLGNSIAVVEVNGVIMESKETVELIQIAEEDKETKAIIIRINSPGGAVGPTQEIYEEIRRIDSIYTESNGTEGKPVYASFGSIAASGGYYIGSATRKIFTNAGTMTGSIGVIMHFLHKEELMKWAKVRPYNIKAGRYKDIGNANREMTAEEQKLLDNMMVGVHEQFRRDILTTRKDKIKGDLNELTQGQIFSGEQAVNFGLADQIAGLWNAGRDIHKELKLENKFGLKFIKKKKKPRIFELVDSLDDVATDIKNILSKMNAQGTAPSLFF